MTKVWFRCDRKNERMFILNTQKEIDYVPVVGDLIKVGNDDFRKASFRVKPYCKDKEPKRLKELVCLDFVVKSRTYLVSHNEWTLICEPTSESLLYLLQNISTK